MKEINLGLHNIAIGTDEDIFEFQNNLETANRRISTALSYVFQFTGQPYLWAGNGPYFDCSGLVCEYLKSLGVIKSRSDYTSVALWARFKNNEVLNPEPGDLIVYSKTKTAAGIQHVGIMYYDGFVLEAGGGNSSTTKAIIAQEQGAFVRLRPHSYRPIFKFISIRGLI